MQTRNLAQAVNQTPRVKLANLPSPIMECQRVSQALQGPRIWVKRDDLTGPIFGGNKIRQLEFSLGLPCQKNVNALVAAAGNPQSNHCRQLTVAARQLGIEPYLIFWNQGGEQIQGNLLVDCLLNAHIKYVDIDNYGELDPYKKDLADELNTQGKKAFPMTSEYIGELGAIAYIYFTLELLEQIERTDISISHLYVASGGATHAGLALAKKALNLDYDIVAINPMGQGGMNPLGADATRSEWVAALANGASRRLEIETRINKEDLISLDDYIGPGYGKPSKAGVSAINLLAQTEGMLLDPIYSAKAFAGLVDHIQKGKLKAQDNILFLHTGGTPALFAYNDEIINLRDKLNVRSPKHR